MVYAKIYLVFLASPVLVSATPPAALVRLEYPPTTATETVDQARRCNDRIKQVRAEAGKPRPERGPASAEKPLLMFAVDHSLEGCSVLVPVANPADLRQNPEPSRGELIPAR